MATPGRYTVSTASLKTNLLVDVKIKGLARSVAAYQVPGAKRICSNKVFNSEPAISESLPD